MVRLRGLERASATSGGRCCTGSRENVQVDDVGSVLEPMHHLQNIGDFVRGTLHRCGRGCDGFWRASFSRSTRGTNPNSTKLQSYTCSVPSAPRGSRKVLQPSRRIRLREDLTSSRFRRWICKISSRSDYPYDRRPGMSERILIVGQQSRPPPG